MTSASSSAATAGPLVSDDERGRVLGLLRRYGWNATSFQVLERGFRYWFDGDSACVAYVDTGGAWVAAGAPTPGRPSSRTWPGALRCAWLRARVAIT